jgi:ketosteroid isomerase-like protein
MQSGDMAALTRMHDAETIAFPPRSVEVKGGDAIMAGYADLFSTFTVSVRVEDAHWTEVAPLVVSWGLTVLTLHPKAGGADVISRTRFTDAAIRTKDGWRYLVDHASVQPGK